MSNAKRLMNLRYHAHSPFPLRLLGSSFLAFMLSGACGERNAATSAKRPNLPSPEGSTSKTDAWLGRWNGPEGTLLRIARGQGGYQITVQNLDGPKTFAGREIGGHIEFERGGVMETLRATNGVGTGMKWLSEKKECLVIRTGEGFCRD